MAPARESPPCTGQTATGSGSGPDDLACRKRAQERIRDIRVELRSGTAFHLCHRAVGLDRGSIRTGRCHRVECVDDGEEPCLDGYLETGPVRGIAAAVPPLVMEEDVGQCGRERVDPGEEPRALDRMGTNLGELGVIEAARLAEHLGADVHLAHVVQNGAEAKQLDPLVRPAEPSRDRLRVPCDPRGMPLERGVASAHGSGENGQPTHEKGGSPHAPKSLPVHSRCARRRPTRGRHRRGPGGARARDCRPAHGRRLRGRGGAWSRSGSRVPGRGLRRRGGDPARGRSRARRGRGRPSGRSANGGRGRRAPARDGPHRLPRAAHRSRGDRAPAASGRGRLRDGVRAPHHARPVHGRPLLPGHGRGVQGRPDRGRSRAEALPDADDRGGHDRAGPRARDGRGRRRPAGDRDRAAARQQSSRHSTCGRR